MKTFIVLMLVLGLCLGGCSTEEKSTNEVAPQGAFVIGPIDAPYLAYQFLDDGSKDPGPISLGYIRINGSHQLRGALLFSDISNKHQEAVIYDNVDMGEIVNSYAIDIKADDIFDCNNVPVTVFILSLNMDGSANIFITIEKQAFGDLRNVEISSLRGCLESGFTRR